MKKLLVLTFFISNTLFAQTHIDSLKNRLTTVEGKQKLEILCALSKAYRRIEPDTGLEYGNRAFDLATKLKDEPGKAKSLKNIGVIYKNSGDYAKALEHFKKSFEINASIGDKENIAFILNDIGFVYKILGDYDKALEHHLLSLEIREEMDDKHNIAYSLNNIGNIYKDIGNYEKALEYHIKSIEPREEIGDTLGIAYSLNKIGIVLEASGNFSRALTKYLDALEMRKKVGKKNLIAHSYINVGNIYKELKDDDKALANHRQAYQIFSEIKNKKGISLSLNKIGDVHDNSNDYTKALEYYIRSFKTEEEIMDRNGICNISNKIGNIYLKLNSMDRASAYFNRSLKVAREIGSTILIKNCYENLTSLNTSKGDYRKALEYFKLYSNMVDSLYNDEKSLQIAHLQTKYEIDKKEKEIELLKLDNTIQELEANKQKLIRNSFIGAFVMILLLAGVISNRYFLKKRANMQLERINENQAQLLKELRELNATKDKFFSIIAHDLKDTLQVQLSGSRLLSDNFETISKKEIKFIGNGLKKNTNKLLTLLENLLQWARIQMGRMENRPTKLPLHSLVKECVDFIIERAIEKNIHITYELKEEIFVRADQNMIKSIILNVFSNAIKFTDTGGKIEIKTKSQNGYVELTVSDTGIGISTENRKKIFRIEEQYTTLGTEDEKGTGLGLILCKEFIEKNGGEIWVDSEVGKGTSVTFTLPIDSSQPEKP